MIYADFIRSLPCSVCEKDTGVVQHHLIDIDGIVKGLSLKVPEMLSIPLCDSHHKSLHDNTRRWEKIYGSQGAHLCKTLLKAQIAGWEFTDKATTCTWVKQCLGMYGEYDSWSTSCGEDFAIVEEWDEKPSTHCPKCGGKTIEGKEV